jgi:O-succinylbenzoate synthase
MALYPSPLPGSDALGGASVRRFSLGTREGLLVQTPTRCAEISPLPGRSKESLEEALSDLLAYFHEGKTENLCASVHFGLESLFAPRTFPVRVPLCPLLTGSIENILKQARIAAQKGCRVAKVKISSIDPAAIPDLIDQLSQIFSLRIDCNLAFSYAVITALLASCKDPRIEYVEDPTYEMHKLWKFPFPLALDEPLATGLPEHYPTLCALILKPTVLGGFKGCRPFIDYAHKHHLKVIWSSALESSVGLIQIAHMATQLGLDREPLGLDTMQFFSTDAITQRIDWGAPELHLETKRLSAI